MNELVIQLGGDINQMKQLIGRCLQVTPQSLWTTDYTLQFYDEGGSPIGEIVTNRNNPISGTFYGMELFRRVRKFKEVYSRFL